MRVSFPHWAGVVTDCAGVYVERIRGPAHARWTVRAGERDAVVIEPESYLDGERSDLPLRTLRSVHVERESRLRHVVVFDHGESRVRLVCSDPAAAARVAARCGALRSAPSSAEPGGRASGQPGRRPSGQPSGQRSDVVRRT